MSDAVRAALAAVIDGRSLGRAEARAAMGAVMDGEATPAQLAAFLVALRMRGETVDELAGFAEAMRERVLRVEAPAGTIDTCGTGGDHSGTFNISTAAAFVVAAAGVPVAKHGNRAITSKSGSADVLEALGVRTDHDATSAAAALRELGFAFLFAPGLPPGDAPCRARPAGRSASARRSISWARITNPAGARRQVIGVGDPAAAPRLAEVLRALGTERALIVHGDGVDELPLDGSGVIHDVTPGGHRTEQGRSRRRSAWPGPRPRSSPAARPGRTRRSSSRARRHRPRRPAGGGAAQRSGRVRRGRARRTWRTASPSPPQRSRGLAARLLARLRAEKAASDRVRAASLEVPA